MNINTFQTITILESLPENRPLEKDSGRWLIRDDSGEKVLCEQNANETFREFIIRYAKAVLLCENHSENFQLDLADNAFQRYRRANGKQQGCIIIN